MKTSLLLLLLTFAGISGFAQTDTTTAPADSVPAAKSTLTIGAVYANDASYYGQKAIEKNPYAAVAATYRLKSGIYFSGLAYKLLNEKNSAAISASSLGAGISGHLFKHLSADLGYSHSFFPSYSPLLQAGNPDNVSLGLVYESFINFNLTGDYAFGKTNDVFATGGISKSINLFSIGKKDVITINPSADVVAGTQRFYQTYVTEKKLRDSILGTVLGPITGNPNQGSTTKTVSYTAFNLLSYNFKLPLAYNRAHYVIEANYQLSVLSNKAESGAGNTNSFLTLSFYYQF